MRPFQLMTMIALDQRRTADGEMRATLSLARLGNLSLGNAHAATPRTDENGTPQYSCSGREVPRAKHRAARATGRLDGSVAEIVGRDVNQEGG